MGNAESCGALQAELEKLESTLAILAVTNPVGCRPLLPHHVQHRGAVLRCKPGVSVMLGPVVGVVGPDCARILLEVDTSTTVMCHLSRQESVTGQWLEVDAARVTMECTMGRPSVFCVMNLLPGTQYAYAFSGISETDATSRCGCFHTLHVSDAPIQVGVVSGNDLLASNSTDVWGRLSETIDRAALGDVLPPPVHYLLHLGGQVVLEGVFEQCWVMLTRFASSSAATASSTWATMEAQVVERMRAAYRFQWSLPAIRHVLANTSNVMLWSDQDIYCDFTTSATFNMDHDAPSMQMQVMRVLLRSARRVYHEYQRQLWDTNYAVFVADTDALVAASEASIATTATVFQYAQEMADLEKQVAMAKRKMEFDMVKRCEARLAELQARRAELQVQCMTLREQTAPRRGEECFVQVGSDMGFLMLDMRGTKLSPAGAQAPDNPVLSPEQWDFVVGVLADATLRLLVVCSELPLADDTTASIQAFMAAKAKPSDSSMGHRTPCQSWWGTAPRDQERLLTLLSEWKLQKPNRDVVLLSGASSMRCALASTVTDVKMRTTLRQHVVGPVAGPCRPVCIPSKAGVLGDGGRFEFCHDVVLPHENNFAMLTLAAADGRDPVVTCRRVGQLPSTVHVVVGPVVGVVDAQSCAILLEVDAAATIGCVVINAVDPTDEHRLLQTFPASRPKAFYLTHLNPGQQYTAHFLGLAPSDSSRPVTCSFHTPEKTPLRWNMVLVCNDVHVPFTSPVPHAATSLWSAIEATTSQPFSAVNLVVHLGGQVSVQGNACVDEALALLRARATSRAPDNDNRVTIDLVKEQLRNIYRIHWNVADTRQALSCGSHAMVWSERDVLDQASFNPHDDHARQLTRLLREVAAEYQDQLWLPHSVHSQTWGGFGLYVWRKQRMDDAITDDGGARWSKLAQLLSQPISTLILACDQPLVDDSIEDTTAKRSSMLQANYNSAYAHRLPYQGADLVRLLHVVLEWKGPANSLKQVVCICGNDYFGFDTVIQHAVSTATMRQIVVGPLCSEYSVDMLRAITYLPQGSIGHLATYRHNFDPAYWNHHFGYLSLLDHTKARPGAGQPAAYTVVVRDDVPMSTGPSPEEGTSSGLDFVLEPAATWYRAADLPAALLEATTSALTDESVLAMDRIKAILASGKAAEWTEAYGKTRHPTQSSTNVLHLTQALYPGLQHLFAIGGLDLRALTDVPSMYAMYAVLQSRTAYALGMVDLVGFQQLCFETIEVALRLTQRAKYLHTSTPPSATVPGASPPAPPTGGAAALIQSPRDERLQPDMVDRGKE